MKLIIVFSTVVALMLARACEKPAPPPDMVNELAQMERAEHIEIGWVDGKRLELIAFGTKPYLRQIPLSTEDANAITGEYQRQNRPAAISEGSEGQLSPDGKWIAYRSRDNKFVLADPSGKVAKPLLDGKEVLTPMYWSPNSQFLMYVEKSGAWEGGFCAKNLADGRDVMVYRLRDGARGLVAQVCAGYPYQAFRWLPLPSRLLSKQ